jgi:hypothetical protein
MGLGDVVEGAALEWVASVDPILLARRVDMGVGVTELDQALGGDRRVLAGEVGTETPIIAVRSARRLGACASN